VGTVLPQPIQFGKYTLFERIGRGGMADVFKGRVQGPAGFERVFVVKRILPHLSDDPSFNQMFVEEAKMSARLNHPNIVQVFELGSVEGEYFISMEYVRGRDLAETMRTLWARIGPPRPEVVAYVGREMCRALDYAHNLRNDEGKLMGMIHRDVSPSNVMLSYEGAVKILDFGIAKALGGDNSDEGTHKGTLKGKFAYMAPEQTRGTNVDHRIDVFATGIVLHEILTGRRLFKGENDLQTVEKVRECNVPPPSQQNHMCPPELDAIVMQALAPNPAHRFQSAGEMAEALDDIVHVTRFQPTHLAGLMRDLFPGDAPVDARAGSTGSVRVSQQMPASSSRPLSISTRSPTVPPVTVTSGSISQPSVPSPLAESFAPEKPLLKRTGFVLFMFALLLGGGVGGGVWYSQSTKAPSGPTSTGPKSGSVSIRVDTIPDGAEVVLKKTGAVLCSTPCKAQLKYDPEDPAVLVLRKVGYEDLEREVRPPLGVMASMRPGRSSLQSDGKSPSIGKILNSPTPPAPSQPRSGDSTTPSNVEPAPEPPSEPESSGSSSGSSSRRKKSGKPSGADIVDPFQ